MDMHARRMENARWDAGRESAGGDARELVFGVVEVLRGSRQRWECRGLVKSGALVLLDFGAAGRLPGLGQACWNVSVSVASVTIQWDDGQFALDLQGNSAVRATA